MPSEARQKKIMEKLNRAQKCSILGPQNLGSRGGPDPRPPLDPRLGLQLFDLKGASRTVTELSWGQVITTCLQNMTTLLATK